jgi:hypothetical protein
MNDTISKPRSIRELVFCFAGPTLWTIHFVTLYCSHALFCARRTSLAAAGSWFSMAAIVTMLAVLGLAIIFVLQIRHGLFGQSSGHAFLRDIGLALSGLSALGIVWVTLSATLILPCQ